MGTCLTTAGWLGQLQLSYAQVEGMTRPVHSQTRAPLKVQKPFYPEDSGVCHSVIVHTAGGMVGGDRLDLKVHLQSQSQALVTTAAAGKIYRSQEAITHQTTHIQIDEGACMEWFPQETIVFNGARYQQDLRVELASDSIWLGWDITRFGRSARGEQFLQGNWRARTEIWRQDTPLWIDRQWLPGGAEILNSSHGLAGCPVIGTFAIVGYPISPEIAAHIRTLWKPETSSQVGVTRLMQGLLCRYRGTSSQDARRWFIEVWKYLRPYYFGRSACLPRVWMGMG